MAKKVDRNALFDYDSISTFAPMLETIKIMGLQQKMEDGLLTVGDFDDVLLFEVMGRGKSSTKLLRAIYGLGESPHYYRSRMVLDQDGENFVFAPIDLDVERRRIQRRLGQKVEELERY